MVLTVLQNNNIKHLANLFTTYYLNNQINCFTLRINSIVNLKIIFTE